MYRSFFIFAKLARISCLAAATLPMSNTAFANHADAKVDKFQTSLETFHFFFEQRFLLRLKAEEELLTGEIKPHIEQILVGMNAVDPSVRIDPQYTEEPAYGGGWELAQKIFEVGSRSAILRAEDTGNIRLGLEFNEGKFVHLLLNQWSYSIYEEAAFHFNRVRERLAMLSMLSHQISQDLLERKLPGIIQELGSKFWQQIMDIVETKMTEP